MICQMIRTIQISTNKTNGILKINKTASQNIQQHLNLTFLHIRIILGDDVFTIVFLLLNLFENHVL